MKKESYEQAMEQLEKIVGQMERGELDIDRMGEMLKEAQSLIKICRDKLYKADEEIKKILEATK
ncbi:MAG: exodeoxyribonuclease VII small subunit [Bacteroidaceae bacterium]|nr:exodeoxyribonuclease VII small subunit [Bacteroidaceae bacterium]